MQANPPNPHDGADRPQSLPQEQPQPQGQPPQELLCEHEEAMFHYKLSVQKMETSLEAV